MINIVFWFFLLIILLLVILVVIIFWQWKQVEKTIPEGNQSRKKLFLLLPEEITLIRVIREIVRKGETDFLEEISELAFNKARLQSSEKTSYKDEESDDDFY